jgi:hypothetical protein
MIEAKRGGGGSLLVKGIIVFQKSLLTTVFLHECERI